MVLLPETFKRLDCSKQALVAMYQVHPCNWSLLSSTDTCTQVFQENLGSATHSTTSSTSTGLLCLSVSARVHYRRRSR